MEEKPTFREALRFWAKLGFISFGGPAGQIAIMHRELVEKKRWVEESRFLHALNFCMLLPGPEATQLATYCGWRLHGVRGGLAAGLLFVLPGALALWGLSWIYAAHGAVPAVAAVFHGLKAAVLAILAAAVVRVGQKALKTKTAWGLAVAAFGALFFLRAPFPAVVASALAAGFFGGKFWPGVLGETAVKGAEVNAGGADGALGITRPASWNLTVIGLVLWAAPVVAAGFLQGWGGLYAQLGWFFSKAAVVTFGGAYAVLPYVGQQAVEHYGWVSASQMVDGLALAETTPGPLIIVLQHVGFLAGWAHPGGMSPLGAATLGAVMTTWVTFVPTYLFVLVGAPYVERLRGYAALSAALAAVTAAVVGVVANLAVWFAVHAVWPTGVGGRWTVGCWRWRWSRGWPSNLAGWGWDGWFWGAAQRGGGGACWVERSHPCHISLRFFRTATMLSTLCMQISPTILVVDDDEIVRLVTVQTLAAAGYKVNDVGSGAEALAEVENWSPALIVLDVSMPGMDGYAVVKALRARGYGRPVLMLTAHDSSEHIVRGLSAGADDYVTKPVDLRVLAARVNALLRRGPTLPSGAGKLYFGETVVDLDLKLALCAGERVPLTRTEFALLALLARNGARPATRGEILEGVWGYAADANTRTVETHLWRLRKKLGDEGDEPRWILTRHGLGYMLAPETLSAPVLAGV